MYPENGSPEVYFDGIIRMLGASGDMYPAYSSKVSQRMNVTTPFDVDFTYTHNDDDSYTAIIDISKVGEYSGDVHLYVFITESNIDLSSSWGGLTVIHNVNRQMVPDQNGLALDFSGGNDIVEEVTFNLDPNLDPDDCEIIVAVQSNSTTEIFNGAMIPMLEPEFENNVILTDILFPTSQACDGELSPRVEIKNYGSELLTSLDIEYTVNEGEVAVYNWTGSLGFTQKETLTLPGIEYTGQTNNTLDISLTHPNGVEDEDPGNNTGGSEFETATETSTQIRMQLFVGTSMSFQISWALWNGAGEIVAEGSGYSNNTLVDIDFPIDNTDCYDFFLYDSGGNGFQGGGYLKLYDGNDIFEYVTEFEDVVNITFHADLGIGIPEFTNTELNIYPNPVNDVANINYNLKEESNVKVEVYSISGALILDYPSQNQNIGNHIIVINTSTLQEGIYFVNLTINKKVVSKRITVIK